MPVNVIPIESLLTQAADSARIVCRHPDRSHGQLMAAAGGFVAQLPERKTGRWLVVFDSGFEFMAALFACWHRGLVPVVAPDLLPATTAKLADEVAGVMTDRNDDCGNLRMIRPQTGDPLDGYDLSPDACALELFTSGSAGERKRVTKSFRQLTAEVRVLQQVWGDDVDGFPVATVSHQHIYGLLFRLLWPLCRGDAFLDRTIFYWEEIFALAEQGPVTVISSPAHLRHLALRNDHDGTALRSATLFSSGGPLALDTAARLEELLGRAPIEVLGSTETGGIAHRRRQGESETSWQPFPGIDHGIRGGRLSIRSPYLPDPEEWYETDDLAEPDEAGGFLLRGRADRIVKVFENRISLSEMEKALMAVPDLSEVRAVMVPPRKSGGVARLGLAVVLTAGGRDELARMGRASFIRNKRPVLERRFGAAALPRFWRFVEELPRDAQGKVTDAAVVELFRRERDGPVEQPVELGREELPGGVLVRLRVPANLACLEGHFPDFPVVPGVCQLKWVLEEVARLSKTSIRSVRAMKAIKFHSFLRPETEIQMEIVKKPAGDTWSFRVFAGDTKYASGRIMPES